MAKDIIGYVQGQMFTDESGVKDNIRIEEAYDNADEKTKKVIDDIFTSLCGYSLATILSEAADFEDEEEE